MGYYRFVTRAGEFLIVPDRDRWRAMYRDEDLGSYHSREAAIDDLATGHTFQPSCGDTSDLGISDNLRDWEWIERK